MPDDLDVRVAAPREDLIRGLTPLRAEEDGNTMVGYPVVFDQWTEINSWEGRFLERVLPSAPVRSVNSFHKGGKIRVEYNHGMHPVVGTSGLGRPRMLKPDDYGVYTETPLSNTSYNRDIIKPQLSDGTLDGMSFRFSVTEERWVHPKKASDHNPDSLPERDIVEFKWHEFGPVDWPAYEAAVAGIRSSAAFALWQLVPQEQRAEVLREFNLTVEPPRPRLLVPFVEEVINDDGPRDSHPSDVLDGPLLKHPSTYQPTRRKPMTAETRQSQMDTVRAMLARVDTKGA